MDAQECIKRKKRKLKKKKKKYLDVVGNYVDTGSTNDSINKSWFNNSKTCADGLTNCCECSKTENNDYKKESKRKKQEVLSSAISEIDLTLQGNNEMIANNCFQDEIVKRKKKKKKKRKKMKCFPVLDATDNNVKFKFESGLLQITERFTDILMEEEMNSSGLHDLSGSTKKKKKKKKKKINKLKQRKHSAETMDNNVNENKINMKTGGNIGKKVSSKYDVNTCDNDVEITSYGAVNKANEKEEEDWFSSLHHVNCGGNYKRLPLLRKQGIFPKIGKWEADEIAQLEKNMKEYLDEYPIEDISHLIYPRTKEEKKFRNETQFNLRMCKGIRRTGTRVYFKVECYFSKFLKKGKYSSQEKLQLQMLQNVHGNKWKTIGLLMNRDHHSLNIVHSHFFSKSKGRWTKEEDQRLIMAVCVYRQREERIVWQAVSKIVGTRSGTHCFKRWRAKAIQAQVNTFSDNIFDTKDTLKMIEIISASSADDYYLIDWNEISEHFNDSISPMWCKWKFGAVSKEVPRSHLLEFGEIIDQLQDIYIKKVSEHDCNYVVIIEEDTHQ